MSEVAESVVKEEPTGLEDVTRSLRALLRTTRGLGVATTEVIERELAMAIRISEQMRDKVVSPEALREARRHGLIASFRSDAHHAVDLAADAGGVLFNSLLGFLENFADQRRPPLHSSKAAHRKATAKDEE